MQLLQRFQQFRQEMAGRDPRQMVDDLVRSGKISPQQLDGLKMQAQSILSMLRR